jgi:hypothetical protein
MLVEGFSTLYFLNSQEKMDGHLYNAMKEFVKVTQNDL